MATILIVTGSVRPQSVNSKVVPLIKEKVEQAGRDVVVADLGVLEACKTFAPDAASSSISSEVIESILRARETTRGSVV